MSVIRTTHLLLRPFEDSDATAFAIAARESVSSVSPWMPCCRAQYAESDAPDWFRAARETLSLGSAHEFGVFSTDGQRFLGEAGLNQINAQSKYCNLGYWVGQSEQRSEEFAIKLGEIQ